MAATEETAETAAMEAVAEGVVEALPTVSMLSGRGLQT